MIQGSPEWFEARLGQITASRFGDVMTKPRSKKDREEGKLSGSADSYMSELLAEQLTGIPQGFAGNRSTEWGNLCEPEARAAYIWETGNHVEQVGYIPHPEEFLVGCSPDGLIEIDGTWEAKCPHISANHIHNCIHKDFAEAHKPQVQGGLWVTDRKWADVVSFDPRVEKCPLVIVRVERDEKYIEELAEAVRKFRTILAERLEVLADVRF